MYRELQLFQYELLDHAPNYQHNLIFLAPGTLHVEQSCKTVGKEYSVLKKCSCSVYKSRKNVEIAKNC
jgi:hypothetical protein